MTKKIEKQQTRFRNIVHGKIKKELRKYISHSDFIGKKGKDLISIPVPYIDIPHFCYGDKSIGKVGMGEGDVGTPIGAGHGQRGEGAGEMPGEHILEVNISLDEFVKILGEELELPRIEPKGKKKIIHEHHRYTSISPVGPESLRHFRRSYRGALKYSVGPDGKIEIKKLTDFIGTRGIKRFKSSKPVEEPESNALILYIMDVSGSMMDEQKEIVRTEAFWIDTWLRSQYDGIESVYIIHDAIAHEVDQEKFYHTRESGGTVISSAYKLCSKIINERFNPAEWNIYGFHFSDGDNWGDDNTVCVELLWRDVLPKVNQFCYGQVKSPYGQGGFYGVLQHLSKRNDKLLLSKIEDRDGIYDSIKQFLGKGR